MVRAKQDQVAHSIRIKPEYIFGETLRNYMVYLNTKPRSAIDVASLFRVNWEVTETLIYPPHPIYLLFGQARSRVFAFIPQNIVNPPVKVAQVSLLLTPFNELVSQCALKCGC